MSRHPSAPKNVQGFSDASQPSEGLDSVPNGESVNRNVNGNSSEAASEATVSISAGSDYKPSGEHDHQPIQTTWGEFASSLIVPKIGNKGSGGYYLAAQFASGKRGAGDNVGSPQFVMLDLDVGDWDRGSINGEMGDVAYVAHTTASHTPEKPRWRILVPIVGENITPDEHRLLASAIHRQMGITEAGGDLCGLKLTQVIFRPTSPNIQAAQTFEFVDALDRPPMPASEMARLVEDEMELELRQEPQAVPSRAFGGDSGGRGGSVIDAFNERTDLAELMFSVGYIAPKTGGNRWISPASASQRPSVVILDGDDRKQRCYSHSAADQDWKCCDAFDVFRRFKHDGNMEAAMAAMANAAAHTPAERQRPRRGR